MHACFKKELMILKGDWALHFWFQEVTLGNEPIKLGKNTKIFINEFSSLPF